jgi:hypothetical protein
LSDGSKRKEYDKLIYGNTDTSSFRNQSTYEHFSNINHAKKESTFMNREKEYQSKYVKNAKVMDSKIKNGVPLDDLLKNYENHREKYKERSKLNKKGWEELKYKQDIGFNPNDEFHVNKAYKDKYNQHNREEVITDTPYWDTKENDEYYSLSKYQRLKLLLKSKVNVEFIYFNLLFMLILIFYANKKSKQIIL